MLEADDFPCAPEDLRIDWLREALASAARAAWPVSLFDVRVGPTATLTSTVIGQSRGLIGELVRVTLQTPGEADATLREVRVASTGGAGVGSTRGELRARGCVLPRARASHIRPRSLVFRVGHDEAIGQFLLLLEDVEVDASIDQLVGLDAPRAHRVITEIAALHAPWWRDESLRSFHGSPPSTDRSAARTSR